MFKKDQEKRRACKKLGIHILEVDYTWDGEKPTILKMIQEASIELD